LAEALEKAKAAPVPPPVPAPAPQASSPLSAPDAQCPGDFSDLFRSASILFALRSAEIAVSDAGYLDRIAALARRCAGYSLTIGGHTDRSGDDGYNQKLSHDRAQAVRDALVARGIAKERIDVQGFSSQRPFDTANNRAAFSLNRRVDLGASLTPASKVAAKPAEAAPAAAAPAPVVPPSAMPIDQCNAEFSRAFLADTIRFSGSSAIVADNYADVLDRIAALALSCPTHNIMIGGHTDRRGSAAFNQTLSEERANAVRDALIDRDVPEDRITANGYAGERPFDPGNTSKAYALNRRVDFGVSVQAPKN
jgi:outer membrane protein OmpA-like peptidoglycan-associated protein